MPTFHLSIMEVFWSYLGSSYPPAAWQSSHILHRTGKPLSLLFPDTLTPQSLIILASRPEPVHAIPPKRCWPQVAKEPFFLPGYALSRAPYDPITPSLPAPASYICCPPDRCRYLLQYFQRLSLRYSAYSGRSRHAIFPRPNIVKDHP